MIILNYKIRLPQRSPQIISRPRLLTALQAIIPRKLIAIVAPAGYGKTSLPRSTNPTHPTSFAGLQQLISFALAKPDFAEQLLADPSTAIRHLSPMIELSGEELALLRQVQGMTSLHNFAAYLHALIQDAQFDALEQGATHTAGARVRRD